MSVSRVADTVREVGERVVAAARRSGRRGKDVRVVAVTKGASLEDVTAAVQAGVTDLGEGRAQALDAKRRQIGSGVRWHYIGAVQTNKVPLLDGVDLVHGLHRIREAQALQARGEVTGAVWDVLVQVNIGGEPSKQGIAPDRAESLLAALSDYPRVRPRGFMFMAPRTENAEDVRWIFEKGRRLRDRLGLEELSMGMTDDYEVAIEEGSTIVRIGRAIFRPAREGLV